MGSTNFPFESVPTWLLVVGAILAVAQLAFEVYALLDMLKRPSEELALGGRKWLWAIIILFVNWIGAILYFAVGRVPAPSAEAPSAMPSAERASAAVDSLYSPPKGIESR